MAAPAPVPDTHFARVVGYDAFLKAFNNEINPPPSPIPLPTPSSSRVGGPDRLESAPARVLVQIDQSIMDMFGYTTLGTLGATDFNHHPVILMAVNFMQKNEAYQWHNAAARTRIFPGLNDNNSPPNFSIDGLTNQPFKDGGVSLTAKSFYNGMRNYDDNIITDKFNSGVSTINSYINSNCFSLFAEYYRYMFKITPSTAMVNQYLMLLKSSAFRSMRVAEFAANGWPLPAQEMLNHFAKLKACGASDLDISTTYNIITSTSPAIPTAALNPLNGSNFKTYRGWLLSGYLDWGDMNCKNLDSKYQTIQSASRAGVFFHDHWLCEDYIRNYGYWKDKPSSCFTGDAQVVLADGHNVKPIRDISMGDQVLVHDFTTGRPGTAAVAFVSAPQREARQLYELVDVPGVRFTSTHPVVCRKDGALNQLGFVDPDLASALNPSWNSIPTQSLPNAKPSTASTDKDDVLYDLIFESNPNQAVAGPVTYTLRNAAGQTLEVASEAPLMEYFPHATCFFHGMMHHIASKQDAVVLPQLLAICRDDAVDMIGFLEQAAANAWDAFLKDYPAAIAPFHPPAHDGPPVREGSLGHDGPPGRGGPPGHGGPHQSHIVGQGPMPKPPGPPGPAAGGDTPGEKRDHPHFDGHSGPPHMPPGHSAPPGPPPGFHWRGGPLPPKFMMPHDINVHTLLDDVDPSQVQLAAQVMEAFISRLGRLINDGISTAWMNDGASSSILPADSPPSVGSSEQNMPYLFIHTLPLLYSLTTRDAHGGHGPMYQSLRFIITQSDIKVADQVLRVSREGWMTFEVQTAIALHISSNTPDFPIDLAFQIIDPSTNQTLFKGRGPILERCLTIVGLGDGLKNDDEAVLKVQIRMLRPSQVTKWQSPGPAGWNDDCKMVYAPLLGSALVKLLVDQANNPAQPQPLDDSTAPPVASS